MTTPWTQVAALDPGDHCLYAYREPAEHLLTQASFVRRGLERQGRVLCITDVVSPGQPIGYLTHSGLAPEAAMERGDLVVQDADATYLEGGFFDPDRMLAAFAAERDRALDQGYSSLWVSGEANWVRRKNPGHEALVDYEAAVGEVFEGQPAVALCQYDRRFVNPETLELAAAVHPQRTHRGEDRDQAAPLEVSLEEPGVVRLRGEVDLSSAPRLAAAVAEAADRWPRLVVELRR